MLRRRGGKKISGVGIIFFPGAGASKVNTMAGVVAMVTAAPARTPVDPCRRAPTAWRDVHFKE